jgi:hypothetical protein
MLSRWEGTGLKSQYDAVRLTVTNVRAVTDAEAWREFLAVEGWTVAPGWGTDDIVAWADRRDVKTIPTRRILAQVLRDKLAAGGHNPAAATLDRGEAVIDLTFYRAVDRK